MTGLPARNRARPEKLLNQRKLNDVDISEMFTALSRDV
jgi:hypothetical protein